VILVTPPDQCQLQSNNRYLYFRSHLRRVVLVSLPADEEVCHPPQSVGSVDLKKWSFDDQADVPS
jgi:hypothetical protein